MMIAKLKMKMEMQKAEEERLRREAEEEEKRIRAEQRLAEEQRKFEEAERQREKERRKEEEKLQQKMQRSQLKSNALERMRASGFIVPDVEKVREEINAERDKPQLPPKPRVKKTHTTMMDRRAEEQDALDADLKSEATESDAEVDEADWEAQCDRDERRQVRHNANLAKRAERVERQEKRRESTEAQKKEEAEANHVLANVEDLRSPICCVLGHVDTGKTSLLDYIRLTNVQGGEAGGITQQIGATFFPYEALEAETRELNERYHYTLRVPGLLIIDTPGHESFTNLRSRGSSLCDIAVLVVDIMHGLEPQTRESIRLLRERKCPFIIALNKVDRLYGWVPNAKMDIEQTLSKQSASVRAEYDSRVKQVKTELAVEGLNADLYYQNEDKRRVVSIVPTSAKTGEGVCDLLLLEIQLVQQLLKNKMTYKDDLQCTVLEVKPITGYGFTIDVILINGVLHEGDKVCLCGQGGPIFTQIRCLLTPQPMKELRVRGEYVHHKTIKAAMGIKIAAPELEEVVPGTPLLLVRPGDDKEELGRLVMRDSASVRDQIDPDGVGVMVQSSTLGALEALLSFLKSMKIPVGDAAIGPLHKRHVYQSIGMQRKEPRYAVVLAFDVTISDDARELAEKNDVQIFEAHIIYHLFDKFTLYMKEYEQREKDKLRAIAVFPVQLTIIDSAFHNTDPMIVPVRVDAGQLRLGTPLCRQKSDDEVIYIGNVLSMERDNKTIDKATPGMEVAVKINTGESNALFGRSCNNGDTLLSRITRPSVDAIKKFKDELVADDVVLLAQLIHKLKVPK